MKLLALGILITCCLASFFLASHLSKRVKGKGHTKSRVLAGLVPTLLMLTILVLLHVHWLYTPDHPTYSPAIVLVMGFPAFLINLACNILAAFAARRI